MAEKYSFRSAVNGFHRGDVIAYLQKVMDENTALKAQVSALETENEALKQQAGETKTDGERVDTALLGAAMYDARRFSDLLVSEANETAGAVFDRTAAFAQSAGGKTGELAAAVNALKQKMQETLAGVEAEAAALAAQLEIFRTGATEDKAAFLQNVTDKANEKFGREKNAPAAD